MISIVLRNGLTLEGVIIDKPRLDAEDCENFKHLNNVHNDCGFFQFKVSDDFVLHELCGKMLCINPAEVVYCY